MAGVDLSVAGSTAMSRGSIPWAAITYEETL